MVFMQAVSFVSDGDGRQIPDVAQRPASLADLSALAGRSGGRGRDADGDAAVPGAHRPPAAVRLPSVLLACNVGYGSLVRRGCARGQRRCIAMAMLQMEVDLLALTAVLHFSGGVMNPFLLFYVFHVIIATIILPRSLSFVVGPDGDCPVWPAGRE